MVGLVGVHNRTVSSGGPCRIRAPTGAVAGCWSGGDRLAERHVGELGTRADVQLHEHLAEVIVDSAWAEKQLRSIVRTLASDGTAVFLTTQYPEEADQLADRIAILDRGRIAAQGTARELKQRIPGGRTELSFADVTTQLTAAGAMQLPVPDGDALILQIPTDGNVTTLRRVLRELDHAGVDVLDLAIHTPDLDDVFLALTGEHDRSQKLRDDEEPHA